MVRRAWAEQVFPGLTFRHARLNEPANAGDASRATVWQGNRHVEDHLFYSNITPARNTIAIQYPVGNCPAKPTGSFKRLIGEVKGLQTHQDWPGGLGPKKCSLASLSDMPVFRSQSGFAVDLGCDRIRSPNTLRIGRYTSTWVVTVCVARPETSDTPVGFRQTGGDDSGVEQPHFTSQ